MWTEGELQAGCLDEEAALDFVQGRLAEGAVHQIDEHVDGCARCRSVLAEAARSLRSLATGASPSATSIAFTRFAPGEKLSGRYRILRFIARGGMGEVYEAHDLMLNTRLALKTLAATISDNPQAIRRLKQEVNLARLITHPNVCRIFDLGIHEQSSPPAIPGVLFITMELVSGVSLGERLRKDGRLEGSAVLSIARAMVAAIGAAHRANIIHRDLKSDNVMLAPDENGAQRVVVMDFGLARAASPAPDMNSTDGPALAGTLAYMAPEQLEGKPVSPVTDIYALGVVMYEMLTGHLPFKGQPALAAAWRRVTLPAPALADAAAGIDQRWEPIVAACLERDPARRPQAAEQVGRMLQSLDSLPDTLPAISVSGPARSALVGRRAGLAVAALVALATPLAVVGVRTIFRRLQGAAGEANAAAAPLLGEKTALTGGLAKPPAPPEPAPVPGPGPARPEAGMASSPAPVPVDPRAAPPGPTPLPRRRSARTHPPPTQNATVPAAATPSSGDKIADPAAPAPAAAPAAPRPSQDPVNGFAPL